MASIGLPTRFAGCIVVVCILNPPVVLLAELIIGRVGIGIAAQPELLDESLALLIVAEVLEGFSFFVGDDVGYVLLQPRLEGPLQLPPNFLLGFEFVFIGAFPLQRIGFLVLARCLHGGLGGLLGA